MFLFFWINCVYALKISDVSVTVYGDYLLIYSYVDDLPAYELRENLKHGFGLSFTYKIKIYKVKKFSLDEKIEEQEIVRTVYYDPIKNLYLVQTIGALVVPFRVTSSHKALILASSLEGVPIIHTSRLEPSSEYKLKVKLKVKKILKRSLPKKLINFFLFRGDSIETKWFTLKFKL